MLVAYLFIVGLAMGSFANSIAWRISGGKKIVAKSRPAKSRSICESCHKTIPARDLVPVISWVALRGRCRRCKSKISWQHPTIELASGLLFTLSIAFWPFEIANAIEVVRFGIWLVSLVGLEIILINDIKYLEIDNRVIYPLIASSVAWRFIEAITSADGSLVMQEMTLGLLVGGGFFLLLFWISKEKWIGGGDVKLGLFLGCILGPAYAFTALLIAFYSAFIVIVPLMLTKQVGRKSHIPFGPFLILGLFVAMLWGEQLINIYENMFGI